MTTTTFDTHAFIRRLVTAGMPEAQAEAQADALSDVLSHRNDHLVTEEILKHEIKLVRHEIELVRREAAMNKRDLIIWLGGAIIAGFTVSVSIILAALPAAN